MAGCARIIALVGSRVRLRLMKKTFQMISEHYRDGLLASDFRFGKAIEDGTFFKRTLDFYRDEKLGCYNFNGVQFPFLNDKFGGGCSSDALYLVFFEVLLIHCLYGGNYDKFLVSALGNLYDEGGPYELEDGNFDVRVKPGDVVVDAGAWCGDFGAYAALKGATTYAFEISETTFRYLEKTVALNEGKIVPVKMGLSNSCEVMGVLSARGWMWNGLVSSSPGSDTCEKVEVTTLDAFVQEKKIKKIDFIKADIEGAERDMLEGTAYVLKTFAPKLAICTYHLPDDPQVLRDRILSANPRYTIVQMRHKLYACVC
jgi:FkbM family methyltransferase